MKKLIALSAILSMSVAFAEDVVYGTFVLNSSEEQVVLCVPWINPGSADGAINVTDLIQTSTLEVGDQLFYYNGKGYNSWSVATTVGDKKVWQAVNTYNEEGVDNAEPTLIRGNAVILKRTNMDNRTSKDIIINGQVGTTPVGAMKMARVDGIAYSLIAPANPDADTSINSGEWTGVTSKDRLFIGITPYYWSGEYWGSVESKLVFDPNGEKPPTRVDTVTRVDASIPAGKGAWFMAQGEGTTTTWDPQGSSNL